NSAWANGTAKQIECSELAWEIITTETSTTRSAPNSLSATPGMPIIPVPSTLSRAISSIVAKPLTGIVDGEEEEILVPVASGLKVFLIQMGMPLAIAGNIVFGCTTLAPKYASSAASW